MLDVLRTKLWPVALFTLVYLSLATSFVISLGNAEFLLYIVVVIIFGGVTLFLRTQVGITMGVVWGLSVWGLLHMAGGLVPIPETWPRLGENVVLYNWWIIPNYLKYDHFVHGYGFFVATIVCWQALKSRLQNIHPTFGVLTLCVLAGMGLGALNEIVEFMAVVYIPNTNVGGYMNTGFDLISNLVGAVLAASFIRWNADRPSQRKS